jgi:hypothetical protein
MMLTTTAVLSLWCPHEVQAQESRASEAELDDIEQEGFDHFASQNWTQAVVKWSEVLDQDPSRTHLIYFKAQALFKSGDREAARRHALRAREATPPLKDNLAKKNEGLLIEIGKLDAQEAEQKREQMELRAEQRKIVEAVRPRASGGIWVGTGALALSAAGFGAAAWQADKLVEVRERMEQPQTRPEYDVWREEADGYQLVGNIFLWSSVALAATGVGIIVWDLMTPEPLEAEQSPGPALSVGVTPNGAMLRLTW